MSQPNGDPSSPRPPSPDDAPTPPSWEPSPLAPTPRANPPSISKPKDAPPAPPAAAEASFNDFLAWMQARANDQAPAPAPAPTQRTLLPKEQKKFHRAEPDAKADHRPSPADADAVGADPAATVKTGGTAPPIIRRRRKAPANEAARGFHFGRLLWPLLALAILAGAFKLGRATVPARAAAAVPPAKAPPRPDAPQSARVSGLIDQAMASEGRGEYPAAAALLGQAQALDEHVPGLEYHLALLAYESGDVLRAISLLDRGILKTEESAECYNLRGAITNRVDGIDHGLENLETATHLDPFNARYFFYLGEALRRAGKPQLALVRLRQALDRLREPSLEGLYESKVRLTQIELGQDNEFSARMAEELQRDPPPADWLLTAAALEMHRGHPDLAAAHLDKVLAGPERATVKARLGDFFFVPYSRDKLLARFFEPGASPSPAPAPSVDPTPGLPPGASPAAPPAAAPGNPAKP